MRTAYLIALSLICACAPYSSEVHSDVQEETSPLVRFLYDPFEPPIDRSIVLGDAVERVRDRFGQPNRETLEIRSDRRDPTVTSETLTWYYDGMVIYMSGSVNSKERWIHRIEVSDRSRTLRYGLGIGSTRSEILAVLSPERAKETTSTLRFDSEYTEHRSDYPSREGESVGVQTYDYLIVEFDRHDHVTKMEWNYYAD